MSSAGPHGTPPLSDRAGSGSRPTAGFGRLAQRISGLTSNILATALVLVIGLGVGRQVVRWWTATPESKVDETALAAMQLGDEGRWHALQFADRPGELWCKLIQVDAAAARAALKAECRKILQSQTGQRGNGAGIRSQESGLREGDTGADTSAKRQRGNTNTASLARRVGREPGRAERRFLDATARLTPADEKRGEWQLFELDGPFPLAAGIVAKPARRVIVWGMAVPAPDESWKLYVFQPATSPKPTEEFAEVPLPAGSRRTVAMRAENGGALVAFRESSLSRETSPREWKTFYESWLPANGWSAAGDWQTSPGACFRRYETELPSVRRRAWLDVQFIADRQGWAGVLTIAVQPEKKEPAP